MASFSMTCTCGHTETVEAADRDAAVSMFRAGMSQQALDEHMAQYHQPGEQKPTLEHAHAMIGATVQAAA